MRVVVAGPHARTFKFVAEALTAAGHEVVSFDPENIMGPKTALAELSLQGVLNGPIDAYVNLVGRYKTVATDETHEWHTLLHDNLFVFAWPVIALLPKLRESKGTVVAVDRAGHYSGKEAAYSVAKAALGEFMHTLHHDEPALDVVLISPQHAIDTDEIRKDFAQAVLTAVTRKATTSDEYFKE